MEPLEKQPDEVNFQLADGIFVKAGLFEQVNTIIPQHAHEYDHTTFLATGELDVYVDGDFLGNFKAPAAIFIPAKKRHMFMTLQPNTQILCIHNISRTGQIDIHELHELNFP